MLKVQFPLNPWDGKNGIAKKRIWFLKQKNGVRLKLLNVRKITSIYFHFQKTTDAMEKNWSNRFCRNQASPEILIKNIIWLLYSIDFDLILFLYKI
jgi:hypothetical protein